MAKNDVVLVDYILRARGTEGVPSRNEGEVFEFFSAEQILKDYDLDTESILSGIVDGKDDGGIDSIYLFVNGSFIKDLTDFSWPHKNCEVSVYIITSKHHDTFKQEVVNNEYASISELFDLRLDNSDLKGDYNSELLYKRRVFIEVLDKTATALTKFTFHFYYVSRGDTSIVGRNIKSRANQIKNTIKELYSSCEVDYSFIGSSELLSLYRKKPEFELEMKHSGIISYGKECFIVLCNLKDYYSFISDDTGKLRKYLFDSNVRDFLGFNTVNEDIYTTLNSDGNSVDFWWFNNGVTVLARHAVNLGNKLKVKDVQIVNGLQTSQAIFEYFSKNSISGEERSIMVKIISQTDLEIRDRIIRSTNNQSAIAAKSLFATEKIQRDIEDIMKQNGFYYERRVNYYKNQDADQSLIFDIMSLGAGYLGYILRVPERAANFKQKILKDPIKYNLLFNHGNPLEIWPFLARFTKRIDKALLSAVQGKELNMDRFFRRSRYVTGIIVLGRTFGTYNYSTQMILSHDDAAITDSIMEETALFVIARYRKELMLSRSYLLRMLADAASKFGISEIDSLKERNSIFISDNDFYIRRRSHKNKYNVSEDIVAEVKKALPPQPWPIGTSQKVADELGIDRKIVYNAISILMDRSDVFIQRNGILYDNEGNMISNITRVE